MAARTRVVVTTVGPYTRYGLPLVAACAGAGTDYADLTGESPFIRSSIDLYHKQAVDTGARIVHSCGFDSVPSDLSVYALYRAAGEAGAGELVDTDFVVRSMAGGLSGGTIASLLEVLRTVSSDPDMRRQFADPYTLSPDRGAEPELGAAARSAVAAWSSDRAGTDRCMDRRVHDGAVQHPDRAPQQRTDGLGVWPAVPV